MYKISSYILYKDSYMYGRGRPPTRPGEKKIFQVALSKEVVAEIRYRAWTEKVPITQYVEKIFRDHIEIFEAPENQMVED